MDDQKLISSIPGVAGNLQMSLFRLLFPRLYKYFQTAIVDRNDAQQKYITTERKLAKVSPSQLVFASDETIQARLAAYCSRDE